MNDGRFKPIAWPFRADYSENPSNPCYGVCLPLTSGLHTIIDADDYIKLPLDSSWCTFTGGYVRSNVYGILHRIIIEVPCGLQVDHINGNKLDNRKSNLRIVNSKQNIRNRPASYGTSPYKGVSYFPTVKKWRAQIRADGARKHIGLFATQEEAASAYNKFASELHGEYAHLNTIDGVIL